MCAAIHTMTVCPLTFRFLEVASQCLHPGLEVLGLRGGLVEVQGEPGRGQREARVALKRLLHVICKTNTCTVRISRPYTFVHLPVMEVHVRVQKEI